MTLSKVQSGDGFVSFPETFEIVDPTVEIQPRDMLLGAGKARSLRSSLRVLVLLDGLYPVDFVAAAPAYR